MCFVTARTVERCPLLESKYGAGITPGLNNLGGYVFALPARPVDPDSIADRRADLRSLIELRARTHRAATSSTLARKRQEREHALMVTSSGGTPTRELPPLDGIASARCMCRNKSACQCVD